MPVSVKLIGASPLAATDAPPPCSTPRARKICVMRSAVSTNCGLRRASRPRGRGMRMSNTRSMRPGRGLITTTRSASSTASSIECVMNTTVLRVDSHSASTSSRICSRVSASSAPNGSSNSSSGASWISARAMATRWRMPPESSCGKRSTKSPSPTCASSRSARSRYARGLSPRSSTCTSTLSSTLRQSSSTGLWNTMPTSVCGRSTSRPPTRTSPALGRCSPATIRSSVLLPQPDGPTIARNSPSRIARSIGSSACVSRADAPCPRR